MNEKLKIDYVSDIHVNHWMCWIPNQLKWEKRTREWTRHLIRNRSGEVLVIAGDISEVNVQTKWVLDEVSKYYERVYWTFGNHDLYIHSKKERKKYGEEKYGEETEQLGDSIDKLDALIEQTRYLENVVPLIKRVDVYKGVKFAGDALWYLPKSEEDWAFYRGISNDSRLIELNAAWTLEDVPRLLYKESMDWYDTLENEDVDVMVTHVPPVHPENSVYPPNNIYMSKVHFLASTKWVCGHTHTQGVFEKAGTDFYMNCIGYPDAYQKAKTHQLPPEDIDPVLQFGVKTFEVKIPVVLGS